ncbi:CNP1-like family protein [Xylophilus sp.]|uniref:CNP1-like family protein n=1 Tax=Xylophilus sp. TaxID=2653893 RepID=UPI002D8043BE|nr:CNP1-like family protein [Xylophilus sp.]
MAGVHLPAQAELFGLFGDSANKPAWKEGDVPTPPAFSLDRLIEVETSAASSLRSGIDPSTISIGADGVVRYVAVARNDTATNISYEGIRCNAAEHRVYARYYEGEGWKPADGEWHALVSNRAAPHARALARGGICVGAAPNTSPAQIARDLRNPPLYQTP